MGVLIGIKNFTSIKIRHKAKVDKSYQLDERTFVDKEIILYLPPSNEVTGLPTCGVSSLINRSLTAL